MDYSRASNLVFCALMFFGCSSTAPRSSSSPLVRVTNYDECVRAGYPTGKLGIQERCWTPNLAEEFVKGIKPTIQEGVYGTLVLRTGDCMPRGGYISIWSQPCQYKPVDRRIYVFAYSSDLLSRLRAAEPKEVVLNSYRSLMSMETRNAFYQLELPAGWYIVLAEDEEKLWPTGIAIVEPGERKEKHLVINKATD